MKNNNNNSNERTNDIINKFLKNYIFILFCVSVYATDHNCTNVLYHPSHRLTTSSPFSRR